ncbi:MAG: hypothetical protein OJF48_004913 [Afipia sp.]|nr:MAG: hypothetical protein OJF48_004913 [Afipia sp.]
MLLGGTIPSDETRKRPSGDASTDASAAARPLRPGVARAGALAPTRSGAAGVAAGNRTVLGDQSVGGIGASESRITETPGGIIVRADSSIASESTPRRLAGSLVTPFTATAHVARRKAIREKAKTLSDSR